MALSIGARIGNYEIVAPLGAGGMGEVYRAHDARLRRDVALKVLPDGFSEDAERLARFTREAQVLASLNHPNIASLYGVEERALVMELVSGPTLAERMAEGPMPIEEALPIAGQIAEGLEYAHERGIIHRDLKPANIKIDPEGRVKILDFGLAKSLAGASAAGAASNATVTIDSTVVGTIMGTAAYMSPEQAKGKPVDRAADVWAFGVLLVEMLSGRRLYAGETAAETLAAVLMTQPDLSELPGETPENVRRVIERCLEKDPSRRLRDIREARIGLEAGPAAPVNRPSRQSRPLAAWAVAAVMSFVAATLGVYLWRASRAPERPLMRFNVDLGPDATIDGEYAAHVVISRDGTRIAYTSVGPNGVPGISTRRLDAAEATALEGTEGAHDIFFAPDGQWIGFFAGGKLKKIPVQGGIATVLCDAQGDRGASWGEDGNIIAALEQHSGLWRIPAAGGVPQPLTQLQPGEHSHRWPQVLPGARGVLFTVSKATASYANADIDVLSVPGGARKTVHHHGYYGRYLPSGHLLFASQGALSAAPFDLDRLEMTALPQLMVEKTVDHPQSGGAQFDFSRNGTLVFMRGETSRRFTIQWVDRTGVTQALRSVPGLYDSIRLSPDGRRLALSVLEGENQDVWVCDWERDALTRITTAPGFDGTPAWTPDGRHLVFASLRNSPGIHWVRADGAGEPELLTEGPELWLPRSFTPDGKLLVMEASTPQKGFDISLLPLDTSNPDHPKAGPPIALLRTTANEREPSLSPDGRWLAYSSDEAGVYQVYVRPLLSSGKLGEGKWQISSRGGRSPRWVRNGSEIVYLTLDRRIMTVKYTAARDSFSAAKPVMWLDRPIAQGVIGPLFDPSPDGSRVAAMMPVEGAAEFSTAQVTVLLNFFDEVRRKVPAGGR